jgi:hypothetical protein
LKNTRSLDEFFEFTSLQGLVLPPVGLTHSPNVFENASPGLVPFFFVFFLYKKNKAAVFNYSVDALASLHPCVLGYPLPGSVRLVVARPWVLLQSWSLENAATW